MGKELNKYRLVADFIEKYSEEFDDYEKRWLLDYTKNYNELMMTPDLVREVYDELGIIDDEENIYLGFIDLLDEKFDIKDKKIIEVGGGIFPNLAKKIVRIQDRGMVTVYDPRLNKREKDTDKLKLVREKYYSNSDVNDAELLIGFMPCEATYHIIESATTNNIDFMIALCEGGPHGDIYDYFDSEEEWLDSILHFSKRNVEDNNMGRLEKTYLKKYHNPYPVIYNVRDNK